MRLDPYTLFKIRLDTDPDFKIRLDQNRSKHQDSKSATNIKLFFQYSMAKVILEKLYQLFFTFVLTEKSKG